MPPPPRAGDVDHQSSNPKAFRRRITVLVAVLVIAAVAVIVVIAGRSSPSRTGSVPSPGQRNSVSQSSSQSGSHGGSPPGSQSPSSSPSPTPTPTPRPSVPLSGVKVAGDAVVDESGVPIQFDGIGRSGSEYSCLGGKSVFVGPTDAASVTAMLSWHVDVVRIPLNEDCWLGINKIKTKVAGANYQAAIAAYVKLLTSRGIAVDLDLHWSAPGKILANAQQEMPDLDHSVTFWSQVAETYRNQPLVMFELYNEPYGVSWTCWSHGCEAPATDGHPAFAAVGMQTLVTTVRATGAHNVLLLDGLQHAATFKGFAAVEPTDPDHQLAAAWHVYGPGCTQICWQSVVNDLTGIPVVVTEFGELDCQTSFNTAFMSYLDDRDIGYLAWAWTVFSGCSGPSLISSYRGTPNGSYGQAVHDHYVTHFP